jgi:VWFA-related protein
MRRLAWMLSCGVTVGAIAAPRAQTPTHGSPQQTAPPAGGPTFRVEGNLATVDAVVVDQQGRHVTDLTAADFEVVERGKTQRIRQVVYVRVANPGRPSAQPAALPPAPASPGPAAVAAEGPAPVRTLGSGLASPDRTGRILAIVVDDLGMSMESIGFFKKGLARFVDSEIEPGDLVAIIRTSGGTGALQHFTTDRRLLSAAVERLRWTSQSRKGIASFEPRLPVSLQAAGGGNGGPRGQGQPDGDTPGLVPDTDGPLGETVDELRDDALASGSLGALQFLLRGIETLPGRKSVVFVSEGFDIGLDDDGGRDRSSRDRRLRTWNAFTRVMDQANRSGVVLYAIDPRGLASTGVTAQDIVQMPNGIGGASGATQFTEMVASTARSRLVELHNTQGSLNYFAEQTGGFAIVNSNGITQGLGRIADDMRGYYLIGFDTALDTSVPWNPKDMKLTVRRKGLTVRARKGLFGPALAKPKPAAPADPLVAAALSPFDTGTIDVRLTTLFGYDAKTGPYVHTTFFVDPATLTFIDTADGKREATLAVLLMAVGADGAPAARIRREVTMTLAPEAYRTLRQRGLLYTERLAIKHPGGYQVRAAILDDRTQAVGTSAQFVEVPAIGRNRIALSGVVMTDVVNAQRAAGLDSGGPDPRDPPPAEAPETLAETLAESTLAGAAAKVFRPGTDVIYACDIYDGRDARELPLSTQTTLMRDGQPIFTGPVARVASADAAAAEKPVGVLHVNGSLTLGSDLTPGVYALRISVVDSQRRRRTATQWVDFEVR